MSASKASISMAPDGAAADDLAAARRVLTTAAQALNGLADSLDDTFSQAIGLMLAAKGRVIVSGMGKSGHVARKIAATLSSTGTPAYFVHPAEASHGDMGAVTRADVVLALSWGGETAELSDLLTFAKRHRIGLIGITGNADSSLAKTADVALVLPKAPEACPMGLAPTTSTTVMLSLGDALAVALMERKGFTSDQYRDFHPGGSLGRALIRVSDLMHGGDEIPLARETTPMREVLLVMAAGMLGCVGIVDDAGGLVGIVTDGDVRRHVHAIESSTAVDVMSRAPKTAKPGQLAAQALAVMTDKKITQLFVLEDGTMRPVGVIHIHDCLRVGLG